MLPAQGRIQERPFLQSDLPSRRDPRHLLLRLASWCRGADLNRGTTAGQGPKPCAVDRSWLPLRDLIGRCPIIIIMNRPPGAAGRSAAGLSALEDAEQVILRGLNCQLALRGVRSD